MSVGRNKRGKEKERERIENKGFHSYLGLLVSRIRVRRCSRFEYLSSSRALRRDVFETSDGADQFYEYTLTRDESPRNVSVARAELPWNFHET